MHICVCIHINIYRLDVATFYYGPHFVTATLTTILSGQLIDAGVAERWLLFAAGMSLALGLLILPHVHDAVTAVACGSIRVCLYLYVCRCIYACT